MSYSFTSFSNYPDYSYSGYNYYGYSSTYDANKFAKDFTTGILQTSGLSGYSYSDYNYYGYSSSYDANEFAKDFTTGVLQTSGLVKKASNVFLTIVIVVPIVVVLLCIGIGVGSYFCCCRKRAPAPITPIVPKTVEMSSNAQGHENMDASHMSNQPMVVVQQPMPGNQVGMPNVVYPNGNVHYDQQL